MSKSVDQPAADSHTWLLGGAIVLATLIVLALPYLESGSQYTHDGTVPYARVYALKEALAEGQVPPRWFPDFAAGYGSPYPSFYGMLFYYAAAVLSFAGLAIGPAVELTAYLTLAASGLAMFFLARRLWGAWPAIVCAVLYVLAPYHLVDAYVRGAFSELAAFVWFPLIPFMLIRLIETGRYRYLLGGGLAIAGLLLTHNLMPMVFLPVALLWSVVELISRRFHRRLAAGRFIALVGAWVVGFGLAAYFWLPILLERDLIRSEYFLKFDYRNAFVSLRDLMAIRTPQGLTYAAGILHVAAAVLAIVAAVAGRGIPSRIRRNLIVAVLGGALYLFCTTRWSAPLWALLPSFEFIQFPWRLLAPATFFLALAAGGSIALLAKPHIAVGAGLVLMIGTLLLHSPLIRIQERVPVGTIDTAAVRSEVWGTQDYRPKGSKTIFWGSAQPPKDVDERYILRPRKGDQVAIESGAVTNFEASRQGTRWTIVYEAATPVAFVIPQYFYPGWKGRLDGEPIRLAPAGNHALIQASGPSGRHRVVVDYEGTIVQMCGNAISAATALLVTLAFFARRGKQAMETDDE